MKNITYILTILLLTSCGSTSFLDIVHLTTIKKQTTEKVMEANIFLSKHKIDTSFSYQINNKFKDSLNSPYYLLNMYKIKRKGKASAVQLRMYDKNGDLIEGWEQCYNDLKTNNLLDSFPFNKFKNIPQNKRIKLDRDISLFKMSEEERGLLNQEIKNYDYILILYWAEWAGWWNKDAIKRTRKYVEKYKDKSLLFIKVNTAS